MEGKVVLVTGATDGIGLETARQLAGKGARVLVHGRSREKAERACEEIRKSHGSAKVEPVEGELSRMEEVRKLASQVGERTEALHGVVHNAGVFMNERRLTPEGFETTFAVNHLAPFLLTHLLKPLLEKGAPSRVVVVASIAHQRGRIDFDDLQGERSFSPYGAYAASKLANILFAEELAERWKPLGIAANSLHPGVITTKLLKEGFGSTGASVEEGASTSVYLASSPEVEGVSGRYFVKCQETQPGAHARDEAVRKRLWEESEKLLGLSEA